MRLIHTTRLELEDFFDVERPPYAILSHCWAQDEVTYQDFLSGKNRHGDGWRKIVHGCQVARRQGLDWIWVDTCCIDKTSTAELSEAINSMFRWYQEADVCLVLLLDYDSYVEFPPQQLGTIDEKDKTNDNTSNVTQKLADARWFTRGFTLQELLAPRTVYFYDHSGRPFGSKEQLVRRLSGITGIATEYLSNKKSITTASISCRMSWASRRHTTRTEDVAYCLLGIFNINMPLLYGEGPAAFQRLQEHIIAKTVDQTIFAWKTLSPIDPRMSFLAQSPADFLDGAHLIPLPLVTPPCRITSAGVRFSVFCISTERAEMFRTVGRFPLACTDTRWNEASFVDEPVEILIQRSKDIAHHHSIRTYERVSTHSLLRSGRVAIWRKCLTVLFSTIGAPYTVVHLHVGALPFAQAEAYRRMYGFKAAIAFAKFIGLIVCVKVTERMAGDAQLLGFALWFLAHYGAKATLLVAIVAWGFEPLGRKVSSIVAVVCMCAPSLVGLTVNLEVFGS